MANDFFGAQTPKLGFGLMRLPRKGLGIDVEQMKQMVDRFMESGFTYFDTAFMYMDSEGAAKKALVDRYPRDSYTLATKLFASAALTGKQAKRQFETSLKRTGAGYFDYYLLHSLMESNYKKYDSFGLWDFAAEKKQQGLIRHIGFSFHGKPDLLEELLTEHPEVEFVQLQLNYADWENPSVASRANYEVARRFGKSIVVMEPVKGGALANPPADVQELLKGYAPDASFASWAIRFAASLEGIITVLSGMSNLAQMEDNLSYMSNFRPLGREEQQILRQAQQLLGKSNAIPCTGCRYCIESCPKKIPIPNVFEAMNMRLGNGQLAQAQQDYKTAVAGKGSAADCIACGQCEKNCPQHLEIRELLSDAAKEFEEKRSC